MSHERSGWYFGSGRSVFSFLTVIRHHQTFTERETRCLSPQ
jgi:hypothetical protein